MRTLLDPSSLGETALGETAGAGAPSVRWVQQALNQVLGLRLATDGVMGAQTRSAVRRFQQMRGLRPDGIPGPRTTAALRAALGGAPTAPAGAQVCALRQPEVLDRFDFDRDQVKPAIHGAQLGAIARCVVASQRTGQPIRTLRVVGHTDPSGSDAHNFTLGRRRAQQVAAHLRAAIDRMQPGLGARLTFTVESRGERDRISTDNARNRRVEVFLPLAPAQRQLVRKRASALTADEQRRYRDVLDRLIRAPGTPNPYGALVAHHATNFRMHSFHGPLGTQRFLTWHRVYLLRLEELGKTIDPSFFIPYWDWTQQRQVPPFLVPFRPTVVVGPGQTIVVERNPPASAPNDTLPTADHVRFTLARASYTAFTRALEGGEGLAAQPRETHMHNRVHNWCNGTMSDPLRSPADPLFWLHHAQVDRLWATWQASHPTEKPSLTGAEAIMDPWSETADQVASIAALGYGYGP